MSTRLSLFTVHFSLVLVAACSSPRDKATPPNWAQVPVSIEIRLAHSAAGVAASSGQQDLDHIGFLMKDAEAVDVWHRHLMAHGVVIHAPPCTHRDGARSLYCRDPEGRLVQLIYHPSLSDRSPPSDAT